MSQQKRRVPLRKCVITKEMFPKNDLIRIVRTKDQQVVIDESGKINGRGAYVAKNIQLKDEQQTLNILRNHLKTNIDSTIYKQLKDLLSR